MKTMKHLELNKSEKQTLVNSLTKYMKGGNRFLRYNVENLLNKLEKLD